MGHRFFLFERLQRYGPVEIGRALTKSGEKGYIAACTSDQCGWSAGYSNYGPACMAAKGHRCQVTSKFEGRR
ncbi:MAG: Mobile element transfer [Streptomyces sp.]|nr:Mobile element transfer [Streptomyces sp.]